MKKTALEFVRRGLTACGFGPIVLAILYLIIQHQGVIETLSVNQVCLGIFSLTTLAFVAGGMNIIYQIEQLPLMAAISIHGSVLYVCYLCAYLLNGWLERGVMPILVFSGIFTTSYLAIWVIIYAITKRNTDKINEILNTSRQKTSGQG